MKNEDEIVLLMKSLVRAIKFGIEKKLPIDDYLNTLRVLMFILEVEPDEKDEPTKMAFLKLQLIISIEREKLSAEQTAKTDPKAAPLKTGSLGFPG
jgi:hypothetical protein